jgi:hypothetical protein
MTKAEMIDLIVGAALPGELFTLQARGGNDQSTEEDNARRHLKGWTNAKLEAYINGNPWSSAWK